MTDLNPPARTVLNTYAGNRDFGVAASAAADRLLAKITRAVDLATLKADLHTDGFAFDSNGQAFHNGTVVPLSIDKEKVKSLAASLRDIEEPLIEKPAVKTR